MIDLTKNEVKHMSGQRYPEEFKIEAVKQVTERGHFAAMGSIYNCQN